MTPGDIDAIEERLSIALPGKYRQLLLEQVLVEEKSPYPYFLQDANELLILNLELRSWEQQLKFGDARWSHGDFAIGKNEGGDYYGIKLDDAECAVHVFNHEDFTYEKQYNNLPEYFEFIAGLFREILRKSGRVPTPMEASLNTNVYIARTKDAHESILNPISMEEWKACVESDPDLELREYRIGPNPFTKKAIRFEIPGLAVIKTNDSEELFYISSGRIRINQPSQNAIAKLEMIATALNANVIKS